MDETTAASILLSLNSTEKIYTEEEKISIKKQQHRLLLLRHAVYCKNNNCMIPYCNYMKELWKHLLICKNAECSIAHCVSSRYILSHYSKCTPKDKCVVCGEVMLKIKNLKKLK